MAIRQGEQLSHHRHSFQLMASTLSSQLVRMRSAEVDGAINKALGRIVEIFDLDRCGLLACQMERGRVKITHAAYANSIPELPMELNLTELFPWTYERVFLKGETNRVNRLEDLPPEAEVDVRSWRAQGVRSALQIPLPTAGGIRHAIGMAVTQEERSWPSEYIPRLRLLGGVFVSTLERKSAEDALLQEEALISDAAESADAGLWKLDLQSFRFWATPKAYKLYGLEYGTEVGLETFLDTVHEEDRQRVRDEVQQVVDFRTDYRSEYRVVLPDGGVRWIAAWGRFQRQNSLFGDRMTGLSVDITARKESELALRAAHEEIQRLKERVEIENVHLRQQVMNQSSHCLIVGQSHALRKLLHQIEQVAPTNASVLIEGETGTGKELVARAIHEFSSRRDRPMVCVNCGAIPAALIESELFGRERGAYTGALAKQIGRFELADGSTILLDEVAELPLDLQVKLLRVLQERTIERLGNPKPIPVNVRIIAATNRDLQAAVREGRFREDLYYRLSVFPIRVPPLRERIEDIPLLAWSFVEEFNKAMGKSVDSIARASVEAMMRFPWNGNVRELRNVIERAMIMTKGQCLRLELLAPPGAEDSPRSLRMTDVERDHICSVLKRTNGRISGRNGAAVLLGLNPSTLASRMHKLGIHR